MHRTVKILLRPLISSMWLLPVLFFSLTGLVLLWLQAGQRTSTWPLVGGGIAIVAVFMMLFVH